MIKASSAVFGYDDVKVQFVLHRNPVVHWSSSNSNYSTKQIMKVVSIVRSWENFCLKFISNIINHISLNLQHRLHFILFVIDILLLVYLSKETFYGLFIK